MKISRSLFLKREFSGGFLAGLHRVKIETEPTERVCYRAKTANKILRHSFFAFESSGTPGQEYKPFKWLYTNEKGPYIHH